MKSRRVELAIHINFDGFSSGVSAAVCPSVRLSVRFAARLTSSCGGENDVRHFVLQCLKIASSPSAAVPASDWPTIGFEFLAQLGVGESGQCMVHTFQ